MSNNLLIERVEVDGLNHRQRLVISHDTSNVTIHMAGALGHVKEALYHGFITRVVK